MKRNKKAPKKTFLILFTIIVVILALFVVQKTAVAPVYPITTFEECQAAGYPVMESYPMQCRTPEGRNFTQIVSEPLPPGDGVACTMEAKECPDGTYVGRSGPNCEFAPCPQDVLDGSM